MKALSVRMPWAYFICAGLKPVENRDWPLPKSMYGQRIYVHAGRTVDTYCFDDKALGWSLSEDIRVKLPKDFDWSVGKDYMLQALGAIIGEVTITGQVDSSPSPWFVGPYGFLLRDAVLYERPIVCRGQLGFFEVNL